MASLLLVHGSWHGAWCWDRLVPLLQSAGHEVLAIDLPAHGEDRSAPWFASLQSYGARVAESARRLSQKPFVVGHSMGGAAITQAAASCPEAFAGLVYLCAFAPLEGDSMIRAGRGDPSSLLPASVIPAPGGVRLKRGRARAVFYDKCAEADAAWAAERLRADPVPPLFHRLRGSPPESLPRMYVACSEDRAVSIGWQRSLAERAAMPLVATLATDHSPFLSAPGELADCLDKLV
jgi:pimeloyl-ACP methyl ester carboxylesterase